MHTNGARLAAAWLALWTASCGHAPAARDEATLSRGFAELQRHEARLEGARHAAARNLDPCPTRCTARDALAEARDAICTLADELADPDARARCEHARHSAATGTATLDAACGCAAVGS